ncbi:MAG: hypothetical protein U9Q74_05495, partial [Gemmatimonadota bacterium]|nr:hypothetical protein [Gemmatimonadota bacterium]
MPKPQGGLVAATWCLLSRFCCGRCAGPHWVVLNPMPTTRLVFFNPASGSAWISERTLRAVERL